VRHRGHAGESGQALVEVALTIPLLLVLLVGTIDLGRLSQFDTALDTAARAGAQYGSLNLITADDTSGMKTAAKNDLPSDVPSSANVSVSASSYCTCYGGSTTSCSATACSTSHRLLYVTVSVTGTFSPFFKYFSSVGIARTKTATLEVAQ